MKGAIKSKAVLFGTSPSQNREESGEIHCDCVVHFGCVHSNEFPPFPIKKVVLVLSGSTRQIEEDSVVAAPEDRVKLSRMDTSNRRKRKVPAESVRSTLAVRQCQYQVYQNPISCLTTCPSRKPAAVASFSYNFVARCTARTHQLTFVLGCASTMILSFGTAHTLP